MAQNATFTPIFLGLGWPWVGKFLGFHNIIRMFSNPTEFGKSQTHRVYKVLLLYCCWMLLLLF